jgi:DNA-binding NtrC family response regulator
MNEPEPQRSHPSQVDVKLIYVVDDERMIGDVVQLILRMEGYRPKFFQNPELALQAFLDDGARPALLLTDYLMSPINGIELIERCKALHPELRTILYSGNSMDDISRHHAVKPDAFLRKPFLPRSLLNLVRSTLNETTALALPLCSLLAVLL